MGVKGIKSEQAEISMMLSKKKLMCYMGIQYRVISEHTHTYTKDCKEAQEWDIMSRPVSGSIMSRGTSKSPKWCLQLGSGTAQEPLRNWWMEKSLRSLQILNYGWGSRLTNMTRSMKHGEACEVKDACGAQVHRKAFELGGTYGNYLLG